MAKNQNGIAITIKAWLPLGPGLEAQIASLQLVKDAHASGNYSALLNAAKVEDVKTEQKTRRIEDQPPAPAAAPITEEKLQEILTAAEE